jgi:hypothetical protein
MIASCYMVQLFADQCFREYQLTYTIEQHLDGDWKNIVKPLGVVANLLFLFSLVLLYVFRSWAMVSPQHFKLLHFLFVFMSDCRVCALHHLIL